MSMISEDKSPSIGGADDFGLNKEKHDPQNLKMRVTDQVVSEVVKTVIRQGKRQWKEIQENKLTINKVKRMIIWLRALIHAFSPSNYKNTYI